MKKIIITFSVVVLVVLVVFVGYWLSTRNASPAPANPPQGGGSGQLPISNGGTGGLPGRDSGSNNLSAPSRLRALVETPTLAFAKLEDGSFLTVSPAGVIANTRENKTDVISDAPVDKLLSATFSADHRYILAGLGSRRSTQYSIYDLETKAWQPLPLEVSEPTWSPVGSRLAYIVTSANGGGVATLDIKDPKAKPQILTTSAFTGVSLSWPNENLITISERPDSGVPGGIWGLNPKDKTLVVLAEPAPGALSLWDKWSHYGLVFAGATNGRGGSLALLDRTTNISRALDFLALPPKCVFGDSTEIIPLAPTSSTKKGMPTSTTKIHEYLFCATPKNIAALQNQPLPDSYLDHTIYTDDAVFKIDIDRGTVSPIYSPTGTMFDLSSPSLIDRTLYFISRFDDKLYGLDLSPDLPPR